MSLSNLSEKELMYRYLVWCFKTTKEELDRVDRKFTQLKIDNFVLKQLERTSVLPMRDTQRQDYQKSLESFRQYIAQKKNDAFVEKYHDVATKKLNPRYAFLQLRLEAIEKAIRNFLGPKTLKDIQSLYQEEMVHRILAEREHK